MARITLCCRGNTSTDKVEWLVSKAPATAVTARGCGQLIGADVDNANASPAGVDA